MHVKLGTRRGWPIVLGKKGEHFQESSYMALIPRKAIIRTCTQQNYEEMHGQEGEWPFSRPFLLHFFFIPIGHPSHPPINCAHPLGFPLSMVHIKCLP
jgi:hypothetical protein